MTGQKLIGDNPYGDDLHLIKYLVVSAISLLVGTIMGVMQVVPGIHNWIVNTGQAGAWIDPLAHTHVNLVGGVTVGMMGIIYFALPRIIKRPIFSRRLADVSFWFSLVGVYLFFLVLLFLGLFEGGYIASHVTGIWDAAPVDPNAVNSLYYQAEAKYYWLDEAMVPGGILMGLGYWGFIANVLLSIFSRKNSATAPSQGSRREESLGG